MSGQAAPTAQGHSRQINKHNKAWVDNPLPRRESEIETL